MSIKPSPPEQQFSAPGDSPNSARDPVDLNLAGGAVTPRLSVVVATRNERPNIEPLLARLGPAVAPLRAEIIVVDDSDDGTPEALAERAGTCPVPVRLLHRSPGARRGGLGSAVIAGARHARGEWVLVMDGDLQHPPEAAAVLARTAMRHDSDIVVGTRYAGGGSPERGLGSSRRVLVSSYATRLVKNLFPRRLAMVSDPLSGLFAFRRAASTWTASGRRASRCCWRSWSATRSRGWPRSAYGFEPRSAGESKASLPRASTFLRHLARLRAGHGWPGSCATAPSAGRAGPAGGAVRRLRAGRGLRDRRQHRRALVLLPHAGLESPDRGRAGHPGLDDLELRSWWTCSSTASARTAPGSAGRVRFFLMNNLLLLARLPVLQLLVDRGLHVLVANAITLVLLFVVRFVVSDRAIFALGRRRTRAATRCACSWT